MDKDYIISEIKRLSIENGGVAPGRSTFYNATGIKESDWSGKIWGRWSDAVREAGFEPQRMQRSFDEKEKIQRLIEFIRHYGKWPTTAEIKLYARQTSGFPSHNTLSICNVRFIKNILLWIEFQKVLKWELITISSGTPKRLART